LETKLKMKKGIAAIGALVIIIAFLFALSCVAFLIMEYNSYMGGTKTANEVVSTKLRESLVVVQKSESEITVINEGSIPSVIIGIYVVNPADNNPQYSSLPDGSVTVGVLTGK